MSGFESSFRRLIATAALALVAASTNAGTIEVVVNKSNAVGNVPSPPPIGAFGYDPTSNRIYVAGFPTTADQQLRLIENIDSAQVVTPLIFGTAWQKFAKGGDLNRSGGVPTPFALLLNPKPIAGLGLGSFQAAWIMDGASIVIDGSTQLPNLTQRIYRFNLQQDTNADASDEFTSVLTLQQLQNSASTSSVTSGMARQFAWSGDGQSLYAFDTSGSFGGVWRVSAATGTATRMITGGSELIAESAVTTSEDIDTIYLRGTGTTAGGIDRIRVHSGGTLVEGRTQAVSSAELNTFLELSTGSVSITSFASDLDGNLYFSDSSASRRGLYRWDTNGRLSKVVSYAERQAALAVEAGTTSLNSSMLRMQPRTISYNGSEGSFSITQILYQESSPANFIAGVNVFEPGDFDRNGIVSISDVGLFKSALTLPGIAASPANLMFDLNGNGEVTWKDVKVLQQFVPFLDGDANLDGIVNIHDLMALAPSWQSTNQTWLSGDFSGDGVVNAMDLGLLAMNWQASIGEGSLPSALEHLGLPMVPEPGTSLQFGSVLLGWVYLRSERRLRK